MPWQQRVVMVALEVQSEAAGDPYPGDWAYDEVGISTQRRAGKTVLLRPVLAHRLRSRPGVRCWSTAQTGVHARRRWLDLSESLVRSPVGGELKRLTGTGHELLTWRSTGSTLEPFAPNAESLHGEDPDLVLVDELFAFDAEEARELRQAYRPGFLTNDAQAWLLSAAGTVESAWLNSLRKRGRAAVEAGRQLGLAWFEWQLPDVVDGIPVEELDDEALVEACIRWHPAYGHTIRPQAIRSAWEEMTEHDYATGRRDFLRAYGNRTPAGGRPRLIPLHVWKGGQTELEIPAGRLALAFEVDPDGAESSITTAARLPDGRGLVEVVERAEGSAWLAARILELLERHDDIAAVSCNDAGPTRDVADLLEAAGVDVYRVSERDYAAACVRVDRELRAGTFLHRGQTALDDAAGVVGKRKLGQSWAWARHDEPISALSSATIALWAIDHAPAPEPESGFWIG